MQVVDDQEERVRFGSPAQEGRDVIEGAEPYLLGRQHGKWRQVPQPQTNFRHDLDHISGTMPKLVT